MEGKDKDAHKPPFKGEMGKVVTRFPPEPSGYLHIGHAKAAINNYYYAKIYYKGKFLIRFDDTNPSKENVEFVDKIKEDIATLGIEYDSVSFTSDYFSKMMEMCENFIKDGHAYADNTIAKEISEERDKGIESKNRNNSLEENLKHWEEMKVATDIGKQWCIRAKINMKEKNKVMRDPVIYRVNITPHHRTGEKFKVYPTYDFACPIVDSLEGVTHAGRSIEYRERNQLYNWMLENLKLNKVEIYDFSRLSLVNTVMSKRKLQTFVDSKLVEGWNDPRFPTVQGIMRRGLTIEGIREFMLDQGPSKKTVTMEWDKLWATNKEIIDPISRRYNAVGKDTTAHIFVNGVAAYPYSVQYHPYHQKPKKGLDLGMKPVFYSNDILVEKVDINDVKVGEKITLMKWGNCIVSKIENGSLFVDLKIEDKDFKATKKITWIANIPENIVPATMVEFGHLINKREIEDEDIMEEIFNKDSIFYTELLGEGNMRFLKQKEIIQIERRGFFYVDKDIFKNGKLVLHFIPDGKTKSMSVISSKVDASELSHGKGEKTHSKQKKAEDQEPKDKSQKDSKTAEGQKEEEKKEGKPKGKEKKKKEKKEKKEHNEAKKDIKKEEEPKAEAKKEEKQP